MSRSTAAKRVVTVKQAVASFLMSCKVEGKSYGTIECYTDKLKGFLWYANTHEWPIDIRDVTTDHPREFLVYLRETPRFQPVLSLATVAREVVQILAAGRQISFWEVRDEP
jgi:hypothetical protein